MQNGRLKLNPHLKRARLRMESDSYDTFEVWRSTEVDGLKQDVMFSTFRARQAAMSLTGKGREIQNVQGRAAEREFVVIAPLDVDVQKGDEIWVSGSRYRVYAVDQYPQGLQINMKETQ